MILPERVGDVPMVDSGSMEQLEPVNLLSDLVDCGIQIRVAVRIRVSKRLPIGKEPEVEASSVDCDCVDVA
jgi:hypothetical protein